MAIRIAASLMRKNLIEHPPFIGLVSIDTPVRWFDASST